MLRALRDGAKSGFLKYILTGLLVLAGGGLVFTDVGGFFRGGVSNNLVAKGKGIEISTVQFDRVVRRILSRQGMSPQEAYNLGIINQILNSEVQTRILTHEAHNLGINVSDDVVMKQISKIAEPLAQNGISKKDALRQVLNSQGVSEGEFVQAIRQEMGNTLFRGALISNGLTISQNQANDLYQYQNERRDVRGFTLMDKYADIIQSPTEENLQKYYESNKIDFLVSEKRGITIATLQKEMIADKVKFSEEDLRKVYDENIDTYKKPERRKLQQAILDRQTDAEEIVKKINTGKTLKTAIKTVTGNTSPYLGENDFEKNGLLEEIATPVFEAKTGSLVGPVQTALGWHVLVLKEIIPPQTISFEKVKATLRNDLLQDRLLEDLVDTANTLDDRLASGEELESVVSDMGLTTEKFSDFNQAGLNTQGKDLFGQYQGDRAQILEASFEYEQDESAPVLEMADGRFIAIRIEKIQDKSYTPFAEVKEKLKARWIAEQKKLTNKQRAEKAFTALKSGKTLSDVAQKYGATLKKFNDLKRATTPKAPITLPALNQIYKAQKNENLNLAIENGYFIAQLTAINLPDTKKAQNDIKTVMRETKEILPQETIAQYINNLSEKYRVKINDRVLKQVYGSTNQN